ncbi:MAG TPA: c-type cytochrome [Vicinamibacterales bacterium]
MTRLLTVVAGTFTAIAVAVAQSPPQRFGFGEPAPRELIAQLDTDVRPDGTGLPPGKGTALEGEKVYARQCAACHGTKGEGGQAEALVGAEPTGTAPFGPQYEQWRSGRPDVPFTVGNYWPYATTLFDYVRRAMPPAAPGTLSSDDVYSVVAWVLAQNRIIPEGAVMNAETLPRVVMPARDRFVPDSRKGGREVK